MLTHEQTTIRRRDADIRRLRKENERLVGEMREVKIALVNLLRQIAKDVNFSTKIKMLEMINELEQDVTGLAPGRGRAKMNAKISTSFDLPPYHVESFPCGSCVCNKNGFNCLSFPDKPGAKFTTLELAIEIAKQFNEEDRGTK